MILFCEECGTRHDIDQGQFGQDTFQFSCSVCHETLVVSLVNKQNKTLQAALDQGQAGPTESLIEPLKVMIVDDSRLIRRVLREIIESDSGKQVIGEAEDGRKALDLLQDMAPDVITLDINMPVMDGLTTLKHIMINRPTPTVMISALTKEGALETFDSLKYGAIDFLPKPSQVKGADLKTQQEEILRKIELAAEVQIESVRFLRRPSQNKPQAKTSPAECRYILAVGVAEGGYGALLNVIPRLRDDLPAAYIAIMHQAPHHINAFANYLDQCSPLVVQRAKDGSPIEGGRCYLAASTEYVTVVKDDKDIRLQVNTSPFPTRRGAINMLMQSLAEIMKANAAGVILTGAGDDGIEGLGEIINSGGTAFVQDPRSCLFKETPMAAANKHAVDFLVSDKQMAGAINSFLNSHTT